MEQEPIPVKIIKEEQKLTLGKSWLVAVCCLSFGLFFFWIPPIMIILLLASAVMFLIAIVWTIGSILGVVGKGHLSLQRKSKLWKWATTSVLEKKEK